MDIRLKVAIILFVAHSYIFFSFFINYNVENEILIKNTNMIPGEFYIISKPNANVEGIHYPIGFVFRYYAGSKKDCFKRFLSTLRK